MDENSGYGNCSFRMAQALHEALPPLPHRVLMFVLFITLYLSFDRKACAELQLMDHAVDGA